MKTSYVIVLNILMLVIGLYGFYYYLKKTSKQPEPEISKLSVAEFQSISNKSKLPDTLKQLPKFVKMYNVYASTNPIETIDSFMKKITPAIVPDTVKSKLKDEFEILKTRTDQVQFTKGFKGSSNSMSEVGFIFVSIIMGLAGLLGGLLANFRGFFELIRDEKNNIFPAHLHFPYLVRPLTGLLCGILIFFLAAVLVLPSTPTIESNQIPFKTMISLIGLAIIAGFASQEFTEKLKVAASALFGASLKIEVKKLEEVDDPGQPGSGSSGMQSLDSPVSRKEKAKTVHEILTYTVRNKD